MNADIRTIRNILIFFVVLAVIGLLLSAATGAYGVYQQYSGEE